MTFFGLSDRDAEASRKKNGLNELLYKPNFAENLLCGVCGMSCKLFAAAALAEVIAVLIRLIQDREAPVSLKAFFAMLIASAVCAVGEALLRYRSELLLSRLCGSAATGVYTVFRENGKTEKVHGSMLAVGDVIFLSGGDTVPADGAMVFGEMTADQSVFGVLGKAEKTVPPQDHRSGNSLGVNNPYCVFRGSEIRSGSGVVKITAVGKDTRIAGKDGVKKPEINGEKFSGLAAACCSASAAAAFIAFLTHIVSGALEGSFAVGFAKGLASAAAALAAGCFCGKGLICESAAAGIVKRLGAKGACVSEPDILGSASETGFALIERTGVISETEYKSGSLAFIDGSGNEYGSFKKLDKNIAEVLKNAAACTFCDVISAEGTLIGGTPIDRAVCAFIGKKIESAYEIKKQSYVKADGENMLTGATVPIGGKLLTFIRGGAEIILGRCSYSMGADGKRQEITNKNALLKLAETISLTGKDVVAFAVSDRVIKGGRLPSGGYTLIGLAALRVDIFGEAAEAAEKLENMGVKVILVTDESRESAIYSVKHAGLKKSGGVILSSEQMAKMSDKELSGRLADIKAVVRAVPTDKRRLISIARDKKMNVCAAVSDTGSLQAVNGADCIVASAGCRSAVRSASDAYAENCGIKAIADIVSGSAGYALECKTLFVIRAVCAAVLGIILIFH